MKWGLVSNILIALSMVLFSLNIWGRFTNNVAPIEKVLWGGGINDKTVNKWSLSNLNQQYQESDVEYLARVVTLIERYMIHSDDTAKSPLPIERNYIIWLYKNIFSGAYLNEYFTLELALDRGVGLCSQHALIVYDLLKRNEFRVDVLSLNGHISNQVTLDNGRVFILDADYGVIMPYSINEVEKKPGIVTPFYEKIMFERPKMKLDMKRIYASPNLIKSNKEYVGYKAYYFELFAIYAIWVMPALMFITGCAIRLKNRWKLTK